MNTLRPSQPKVEELKIIPEPILPHYLDRFEENFGHSKTFTKAKEALYKKDILGSSVLIKTLMVEIADKLPKLEKFCEMYSIIIKTEP
jgi:hypothetical protein